MSVFAFNLANGMLSSGSSLVEDASFGMPKLSFEIIICLVGVHCCLGTGSVFSFSEELYSYISLKNWG